MGPSNSPFSLPTFALLNEVHHVVSSTTVGSDSPVFHVFIDDELIPLEAKTTMNQSYDISI